MRAVLYTGDGGLKREGIELPENQPALIRDAQYDSLTAAELALLSTERLRGQPNVVSGSGATVTLTEAQSGSTCLFDRAAGIVFTLPAPVVGLVFDFATTVSVTSNAHKVITNTGTVLLIGGLVNVDTDTSNAVAAWTANGTTHVSISSNGTTTGGLIGSVFRLKCVTSLLWVVEGLIQGNGIVATPFATS